MFRHATLKALLSPFSLVRGSGRCGREQLDALLAWGRKPSARAAERLAVARDLPIWRCEDAFVRSLGLGADCPPLGLVLDDLGIYYDVSEPSRLEQLIARNHSPDELARAMNLQRLWREQRVSKYNQSADVPAPVQPYVLVVDQTVADISIRLGSGSQDQFAAMLAAALRNHPGLKVVVKTHPDVVSGRKKGHFTAEQLADSRITLDSSGGHPAALLELAEAVYVVTSQLGFEALMWGKEVYCFGLPFFAGWGLTHDELPAPSRRASAGQRQLADLVHAALVEYAVYIDPHTLKPCEVEDLVCSIGLQRQRLAADPAQAGALGFTRWKRPFLRRFMPGCELSFLRSRVRQRHRQIVHWGRASEQLLLAHPGRVIQVEDGFLRSVGFGNKIHLRIVQLLNNVGIRAARPPSPLSWVVDNQGVYYDSTRPSALEGWLATADPSIEQLERAAALRQRLVQEAITKYNLSAPAWHRPSGLRRVVLVPGQVESDASIRFGAPGIRTNLELLKAVRNAEPDAYIIYKPHPDVVAGLRRSSVAESQALLVADLVLREASVQQLFAQVDAVHVLTSLAGFEALLRGIEVHVWGLPFYAGWGLTKDAHSCSRRGRKLSLDALVFGALIAYPRYVSRRSGWQITPEQAIDELVAWRASSTA